MFQKHKLLNKMIISLFPLVVFLWDTINCLGAYVTFSDTRDFSNIRWSVEGISEFTLYKENATAIIF